MRRRRAGVVLVWLLLLALTTHVRTRVWASEQALWLDAVATAPLKPRPVLNLGRTYELAGDPVQAEAAYRRVILLAFDARRSVYIRRFSLAAAETNLAHLAMKDGRLAAAMRMLDSTLAAWPDFPYAHYNKGVILWHVGACAEAAVEYGRALALDTQLPMPEGPCVPSSSKS